MRIDALLLAAASLLAAAVHADVPTPSRSWNLDRLLTALSARTEGTAHFSETRTLAIVTTPLHSAGMLSYRQPDFLEKHVLTPREERLSIRGDSLTIEDGSADSPRTLHLPDQPALLAAIEAIRAPLTGDAATLRRIFKPSLGGSEKHWVLSLVPKVAAHADIVRVVYVRGSGIHIDSIEIEEANGDRSVITIEPAH